DIPRSGLEVDRVEIDARHQRPHRRAIADFVERKAPVDPFHRWRLHGVVNQVGRRVLGIDDIAIVGNADHRRRQVDIEAADRTRIAIADVDDDDLAALLIPPDPAHQLAVGTDDVDDLAAAGTEHDGAVLAADPLGLDVARAKTEAIELVVADERLPFGIADDGTAG